MKSNRGLTAKYGLQTLVCAAGFVFIGNTHGPRMGEELLAAAQSGFTKAESALRGLFT